MSHRSRIAFRHFLPSLALMALSSAAPALYAQGLPPTPANDYATTPEDVVLYKTVVANDTDPDGTVLPFTITLAGSFQHGFGVTDYVNGAIQYVPDADYNGPDSVAYRVCDNSGLCATAWLFVTVEPVNDAPVAVRDVAETAEDVPLVLRPLLNDSDPLDPAGGIDATSLRVVDSFAHGFVEPGPEPGTWTYRPDPDWHGSDSIRYEVCDLGNPLPGRCARAWHRVDVTPLNDGPQWSVPSPTEIGFCLDPQALWPALQVWDIDGGTVQAEISVLGDPGATARLLAFDRDDQASWTLSDNVLRTAPLSGADLGYALRRVTAQPAAASIDPVWHRVRLQVSDGIAPPLTFHVVLRPDWMDPTACDQDGDGLADGVECAAQPCDLDVDGLPNHRDTDADGDGWADAHPREAGDCQANGVPDFLDPVSCDLQRPAVISTSTADVFYAGGVGAYPNCRLEVYDATGRLLHRAQPYRNDWRANRAAAGIVFYAFWLDAEQPRPDYSGPLFLAP